jgi:hypothetical protein
MQDPKEIKLFLEGSELKDHTTLAEAKVENGDTLAMTYALEGEAPCCWVPAACTAHACCDNFSMNSPCCRGEPAQV